VVFALLGLVLTGCVAKVEGLVGLQRVGGHVKAHVQMCTGHEVDTVTLTEVGGVFHDEWMFDLPATDAGDIDLGVFDDAVALLDTGNSFVLEASSSRSGALIHGPRFVADELAALKKGEMLTAAGPLDEAGFDEMVASYCG
jgi:hypothetical protein